MKKILVVILVFLMMLSIIPVNAKSDNSDKEIFEKQEKSLDAYEKITKDKNLKKSEEFGGFFIDIDGNLCVNVVKGNSKLKNLYKTDYVKYIDVENSLESLYDLKENISNSYTGMKASGVEPIAVYISNKENKVVLEVLNKTAVKDDVYLNSFDNNILKIVEVQPSELENTVTDIVSGKAAKHGTSTGSVGFCATKLVYRGGAYQLVKGFVTTGHFSGIQTGNLMYYNGSSTFCGTVLNTQNDEDVDASFVELNSYYDVSGKTTGIDIKGKTQAVEGMYVKKYGINGISSGYVLEVGVEIFGWNEDMLRCDFPNYSGDSGGTVAYYSPTNGGNLVVGIVKGNAFGNSYAVQVNNIFNTFNLSSIVTE